MLSRRMKTSCEGITLVVHFHDKRTHRQKEVISMSFRGSLFFLGLALVVGSNAHAVDSSICVPGVKVEIHDNGSLRSCDLKEDYEVNGIQCRNENRISFYNNGNLESCILSAPATIGAYECEQYALIYFYPDGRLKSCMKPVN